MRLRIRFFSAVLVTETSIVRSSRSWPSRTFSSSFDRALQHVVGGQHAVADTCGGCARSAWPTTISCCPVEQRDLAHLHQVHPHRIVGGIDAGLFVAVRVGLFRFVGPAGLFFVGCRGHGRVVIVAGSKAVVVGQSVAVDAGLRSRAVLGQW